MHGRQPYPLDGSLAGHGGSGALQSGVSRPPAHINAKSAVETTATLSDCGYVYANTAMAKMAIFAQTYISAPLGRRDHTFIWQRGKTNRNPIFHFMGAFRFVATRRRIAKVDRAPNLGSLDGALCGVMSGWGPGEGGEDRAPPACITPE